jgi:hypothetical protein
MAVARLDETAVARHQIVVVDAELEVVVLAGRMDVHRLEHDERGPAGSPRLAVVRSMR